MNRPLKYIYPHTSVKVIVNHLRTTAHSAFPIVSAAPTDTLLAHLPKHPRLRSQEDEGEEEKEEEEVEESEHYKLIVDADETEQALSSSQRDYGILSDQLSGEILGRDMLSLDKRGRLSPDRLAALRQQRGRAFTTSARPLRVPNTIDENEEQIELGPTSVSVPAAARSEEKLPSSTADGTREQEMFDPASSSYASSTSDERGEPVLFFHGVILRSQLVTMLRKRVWFAADQKVSSVL